MVFKVIDNKLNYGKMNFNELPEEIKKSIAPLETVMMYYDRKLDIIFLNEDCKDYEQLEMLCSCYLAADKCTREAVKTQFKSPNIIEAVKMLDEVISIRESEVYKLRRILKKQGTEAFMSIMDQLYNVNSVEDEIFSQITNAFQLGYIMGKREERGRRKKIVYSSNVVEKEDRKLESAS